MGREIDGDFYCAANGYIAGGCFLEKQLYLCAKTKCFYYRRKWPTPEQFKEKYGHEWPEDAAVYFLYKGPYGGKAEWTLSAFEPVSRWADAVVCACAPWGKPPDDWRPQ